MTTMCFLDPRSIFEITGKKGKYAKHKVIKPPPYCFSQLVRFSKSNLTIDDAIFQGGLIKSIPWERS